MQVVGSFVLASGSLVRRKLYIELGESVAYVPSIIAFIGIVLTTVGMNLLFVIGRALITDSVPSNQLHLANAIAAAMTGLGNCFPQPDWDTSTGGLIFEPRPATTGTRIYCGWDTVCLSPSTHALCS